MTTAHQPVTRDEPVTVAVVGATGMLGREIVRRLLAAAIAADGACWVATLLQPPQRQSR